MPEIIVVVLSILCTAIIGYIAAFCGWALSRGSRNIAGACFAGVPALVFLVVFVLKVIGSFTVIEVQSP